MTDSAGTLEVFGTNEPAPERKHLRAGPLTAVLEDGNLRDIRFGGVEVVRAINYLARSAGWGTHGAVMRDMRVVERNGAFEVSYSALCVGAEGGFSYRMQIRGEASGRLSMQAEGHALEDFTTNRTGFVILHPSDVAGGDLAIRHSDGSLERTTFPQRISADQPASDISSLTHHPAPGLTCTVTMTGDAFEMEDQRNWADASFKTYIRPLSKPRPYVIPKGATDRQSVTVEVSGSARRQAASVSDIVSMTVGAAAGQMPALALFVDEAGVGAAVPQPNLMQWLIARMDAARLDLPALAAAARFASDCGASLGIEIICDILYPQAEAEAALRRIAEAGASPSALLMSPRREFKSRPSATLPPGQHGAGDMVDALRRAGYGGKVGSGTPSNFTEFNRNPLGGDGDFAFFSIAANVHAADDISVMETLEVYPELVASACALRPGMDIWLGCCAIGTRHNPYGAEVQPNPGRGRVAASRFDPRHGAQFGASYAVGIVAQATAAGVSTVTLGALAGDFGIFDAAGKRLPISFVQSEFAAAAGAACHQLSFSSPGLRGVAFQSRSGLRAVIANQTAKDVALVTPASLGTARNLGSAASIIPKAGNGRIVLPPYGQAILSP